MAALEREVDEGVAALYGVALRGEATRKGGRGMGELRASGGGGMIGRIGRIGPIGRIRRIGRREPSGPNGTKAPAGKGG